MHKITLSKFLIPISILLLGISLSSCEKVVKFNPGGQSGKLVVEGVIETGKAPVVKLSTSIGFFGTVDVQTLLNSFVHDASVTVSDGTQTVTLKEVQGTIDGIPGYFYTTDSTTSAASFKGIIGKTYYLTIEWEGKTYTSQTVLPQPTPLDSIWEVIPPASEMPKKNPNAREIWMNYHDPDTPGNHVRYFTKRNSEDFIPPLYSVYDDQLVNGSTVSIQLLSGFKKTDSFDRNTFGYFEQGDTVIIKWCAIDAGVYNFWQTLEFSYSAIGNPFASPVEITSNISGGALGVWSGYTPTYDSLILTQ